MSQIRRSPRSLYQALDASKVQVRLLQTSTRDLLAATDSLIEFSLVTVNLNTKLSYQALSYAWKLTGPRKNRPGRRWDQYHIKVNGHKVEVGENLYEALSQIHGESFGARSLWVDALCINQRDPDERSHQVRLMGRIYSSASSVIIWLGTAGRNSGVILGVLERIAQGAAPESLLRMDTRLTQSLKDLLSRDWWMRLWVVQEVTLGKECIAWCGPFSIDFRQMIKVFEQVAVLLEGLETGLFNERYAAALENELQALDRIVSIFTDTRDLSECPWAQRDSITLLSGTSVCDATNARDHIYGILGLLPTSLDVEPDYVASVEEVFETAAVRIMQWTSSVELLCAIEKRQDMDLKLPSWVPPFHQVWGYHMSPVPFPASVNSVVARRGKGRIELMASITDCIGEIGPRCKNLDAGYQFCDDQREYCRQVLVAWWNLLTRNLALDLEIDHKRRFWQMLLREGDGPFDAHDPVTDISDRQEQSEPRITGTGVPIISESISKVTKLHEWLATGSRPGGDADWFFKTLLDLSSSISDAILFVTQKGYTGLIYVPVQTADLVAYLGNVEQPFVLRRADTSPNQDVYKLLAMCSYMDLIKPRDANTATHADTDELMTEANVIVDILQATEVYKSNGFYTAVRSHGRSSLGDALKLWSQVKSNVLKHELVKEEAPNHCDYDVEQAAAMELVHQDLRWIEGPESADAALEQLTCPRVRVKDIDPICYCKAALAVHAAAAITVTHGAPSTSYTERSLAVLMERLAGIVLARAILVLHPELLQIPSNDIFGPIHDFRSLSVALNSRTVELVRAYLGAISLIHEQLEPVKSKFQKITLI